MSYARSFWATTVFLVFLTAAAPASAYVQITSAAPPGGGVGVSYSHRYSLTDSDGRCYVHGAEWSLSLASGALPPGLSLSHHHYDGDHGYLRGTPTLAGTYTGTVAADHCTSTGRQAFNIVIVDTPPVFPVGGVDTPVGSVGAPYSFNLTATGTTPITYKLTAGALPDGLTLSTAGLVTGTPTAQGTFGATVTASNGILPDGILPFIIVIAGPQPLITSSVPPAGSVGVPYTFSYTATGSVPITYNVTEGALPYGLTLSTAGVIDGTPTTDGTFTGTVTAGNGISPDDVQHFSIVIKNVPPIITNGPPPSSGTVGTPFTFAYTATGTPPITYSVTDGALPDGLTLSTDGVIDGTPTTEGYYSATVTASDGTPPDATQGFAIHIILLGPPVLTSNPPPDGSVGYSYTFTYTATGATNINYSVTAGALPPGLQLQSNGESNGYLVGYPTTAGTYAGTVTASSGMAPDAMQDFVIKIVEGSPVFTLIASAYATVGTPYASNYDAIGSKPMTYSLTAGALPGGLTLSAEGFISGTPTTAGTFTGTVTVSNGVLPNATYDFSISVQEGTPVVPVGGGGGGGGGGGALDGITCIALLLVFPLLRARRRRAVAEPA